ncbi:MAG TPA: hypothetical protein VD978_33000 [Azospirillum sp.]|nr:hypothetical protein [Azospirillum sp.]
MIVRIWRGSTAAENAERYERHALDTVFPSLSTIPGHRGAILLRRETANGAEFLALTLWDGMHSVRGFAGEDTEVAEVEPEARAALAEFDDFARHFTVACWDVST